MQTISATTIVGARPDPNRDLRHDNAYDAADRHQPAKNIPSEVFGFNWPIWPLDSECATALAIVINSPMQRYSGFALSMRGAL